MHISEGIMTAPMLAGGAVLTAAGVAAGLRKMEPARICQVAVLTAAFFVGSLIHVPIGPSSAHLMLCGLLGLILGWAAFPAILVGLFLQAVMFGYGGLMVLGVNTFNMALPAVAVFYLCRQGIKSNDAKWVFVWGFAAGAGAMFLAGILLAGSLYSAGREFKPVVELILIVHLPVMIIEGLVTGWAVVFLRKVRPEIFQIYLMFPKEKESLSCQWAK